MDDSSVPQVPQVIPTKLDANANVIRPYFFEREDGSVFHVDEQAADNLYHRGQQTMSGTKRFKYIGCSDGSAYMKALAEAQAILRTEGFESAQTRIRKGVEEELEVARLNRVPPRNFSEVDRSGNPINISNL